MKIPRGDCKTQGASEALAIWKALKIWGKFLRGKHTSISVKSDSIVALALTNKLASASPAMNFLGAELALLAEALDLGGVKTAHIAGVTNELADFLSRITSPGTSKTAWPKELVWGQMAENLDRARPRFPFANSSSL